MESSKAFQRVEKIASVIQMPFCGEDVTDLGIRPEDEWDMGKSESSKRNEKWEKFCLKKENLEDKNTEKKRKFYQKNALEKSKDASIYRVKNGNLGHSVFRHL